MAAIGTACQRASSTGAMSLDLSQLRTFLTVYRTGSVTKAAAQLHLSQPTVSQHMRALETSIGRQLVERESRGITPTEHGHALARELARHLDSIDQVSLSMAGLDELTGVVQLGGYSDLLSLKAIPALAPLLEEGVRIQAHIGRSTELLRMLADGEIDVAISCKRVRERDLVADLLFRERLLLVAAPALVAEFGPAITERGVDALRTIPAVAFDDELPLIARYLTEVFGSAPGTPLSVLVQDFRGILEATIAGAGFTVLPSYLAEPAIATGQLKLLHEPEVTPVKLVYVARRRAGRTARADRVAERLLEVGADWE